MRSREGIKLVNRRVFKCCCCMSIIRGKRVEKKEAFKKMLYSRMKHKILQFFVDICYFRKKEGGRVVSLICRASSKMGLNISL